jgi:transcriptional regulator with XRE-family HTH domain
MRKRKPIFIREWRKHRGHTIEQLAAHVRMSKSALSRVERGERPYNQDLLEAVSEFLRCEPADLLSRSPIAAEPPLAVWERIAEPQRAHALKVLETFAQPFDADRGKPKRRK